VVAQAADGQTAVALYRQERPDVSLVHLRMPALDGVQVVKHIRREYPDAMRRRRAPQADWEITLTATNVTKATPFERVAFYLIRQRKTGSFRGRPTLVSILSKSLSALCNSCLPRCFLSVARDGIEPPTRGFSESAWYAQQRA
jgi:CheY-like chemotaxis protein